MSACDKEKTFALWAVLTHFISCHVVLWQTRTCPARNSLTIIIMSDSCFSAHSKVQHSSLVMPVMHLTPPSPYSHADGHSQAAACHSYPLSRSRTCSGVLCNVPRPRATQHALHLQWCPVVKDIQSSGEHGVLLFINWKGFLLGVLWQTSQRLTCLNDMPPWGWRWRSSLKKNSEHYLCIWSHYSVFATLWSFIIFYWIFFFF